MSSSNHSGPVIKIAGGRVIDPASGRDEVADVWIDGGAIVDGPIDDDREVETIDAGGLIVAPGLVDLMTELREPGFEEDETIQRGGAAALAGGYTTILAAGNTNPCTDSPGAVEFLRQKALAAGGPRVLVVGCVSKDRAGDQMAEIGLLVGAGAVALSDSPRPIANSALLKRALEYCRMFDLTIFNRPGVPELSRGGVMHDGRVALVLGLKGLPTEAEDLGVARDVRLAEETGGRLHVGPISAMGAVDLMSKVKSRGVRVTVSVCPHNLCGGADGGGGGDGGGGDGDGVGGDGVDKLSLSDGRLRSFDSRFKVHPPLRSGKHIAVLRDAVAAGEIDAIQSGHMPRAREKKMNDLDQSPFGLSSLETAMATVATTMIGHRGFDWPDLVQLMSTGPAEIAGVDAGTLAVGAAADVVLIDPAAQWTVDPGEFASLCVSTPLEGERLRGRVVRTLVGGEVRFG